MNKTKDIHVTKKIAFLMTGGTIVSKETKEGFTVSSENKTLKQNILKATGLYTTVSFIELLNIDSSDIIGKDINTIASFIRHNQNKYDSFVIIHGTDTMAYTSSALSYLLYDIPNPIILTGSMIPLEQKKTDAIKNVTDAVKVAEISLFSGVLIVFGGKIILGNRAQKMNIGLEAFNSPKFPILGIIVGDAIKLNYPLAKRLQDQKDINCKKVEEITNQTLLSNKVFLLKITPLLDYKSIFSFILKNNYKGIVIEGFGDGNIPSGKEIRKGLKMCIVKKIIIVLKSQLTYAPSKSKYKGGQFLLTIGAISGADLTTEAALMKLAWVLGKEKDYEDTKNLFMKNICGDMDIYNTI